MSRVAKKPITIPAGVEVSINGQSVKVKGPKGQLEQVINELLSLEVLDSEARIITNIKEAAGDKASDKKNEGDIDTLAGTTRSIINNMVLGVKQGWERKLLLVGVGYRAQVQGKILNLTLGFSHPTNFEIPEGITIEAPSQTEIIVKGIDKQLVGQVSANIRSLRPVEPYKGKGVRYSDERVIRKETKKK